jgi:8-oxo-dGTP diphosphatase
MPKERFKVITAVYLILEKGDEILLGRRANTGYMDGMLSLPAGHHDGNETLREAMAREAKEEIGIEIRPDDMEFVYMLHRPYAVDGDRIDAYFKVTKWAGEPTNLEPEKCSELSWFKKSGLPADVIPKIKLVVEFF